MSALHPPPPPAARRISPSRTVIASFAAEKRRSAAAAGFSDPPSVDFDDGLYVLHVASSSSSSSPGGGGFAQHQPQPRFVSCALSDRSVNTYDGETLKLVHAIPRAHRGTITDLGYARCAGGGNGGGNDNIVVTSGQDGLVRLFDLREPTPASDGKGLARAAVDMSLPRSEEALSVSVGYGGNLAAVGSSKGLVHFFDLRGGVGTSAGAANKAANLLGTYEDAHTDEVTRVRFQPNPNDDTATTSLLVSSSEDGLAVTHDTSQPTEEAALTSIMNVNAPLRDVGFFGPSMEGLYCLTGSETISVWHHDSAQRICDFGDVRGHLSASAGFDIDYLVGCHWDRTGQELSLVSGNSGGDAAIFRVDAGSMTLTHALSGGHRSCVRAFAFSAGANPLQRRRLITGGEDARLCEWDLDGRAGAAAQSGGGKDCPNRTAAAAATPYASQPQVGGGVARRVGQKKKNRPTNAPY